MPSTHSSARAARRARRAARRPSLIQRIRALQGWTRLAVFAGMIGLLVLIVAGSAGTAYALQLENNDVFCASCHTQPESRYYQQSLDQQAVSLAAFHAQKQVRCIDCHSGGGLFGRADGLAQGTQDLLSYYSGTYHNPAITTSKLTDGSCTKCHADVVTTGDFQNHFHLLLARWQSVDPNAARCVDCHSAHPSGNPGQQYLVVAQVQAQCEACHNVLRGGE